MGYDVEYIFSGLLGDKYEIFDKIEYSGSYVSIRNHCHQILMDMSESECEYLNKTNSTQKLDFILLDEKFKYYKTIMESEPNREEIKNEIINIIDDDIDWYKKKQLLCDVIDNIDNNPSEHINACCYEELKFIHNKCKERCNDYKKIYIIIKFYY